MRGLDELALVVPQGDAFGQAQVGAPDDAQGAVGFAGPAGVGGDLIECQGRQFDTLSGSVAVWGGESTRSRQTAKAGNGAGHALPP